MDGGYEEVTYGERGLMETNLKSDEFYVHHPTKGTYYSLSGLMFMAELIQKAIQHTGWDPTQVSAGIENDTGFWVAYPSASTKLVTRLSVKDGEMSFCTRTGTWNMQSLNMADPDMFKKLAEALIKNLPKKSKFSK